MYFLKTHVSITVEEEVSQNWRKSARKPVVIYNRPEKRIVTMNRIFQTIKSDAVIHLGFNIVSIYEKYSNSDNRVNTAGFPAEYRRFSGGNIFTNFKHLYVCT